MSSLLKTFCDDEDGAITVDWVALSAAIAGLAILIIAVVRVGAMDLAGETSGSLSAAEVDEVGVANGG